MQKEPNSNSNPYLPEFRGRKISLTHSSKMRTLAHLLDPHFGRIEPATVQALIATVSEARPDVVLVSGDFTQRAKAHEFQEARRFLDALPSPKIVVPGNHDIPLYNVLARRESKASLFC